MKILRKAEICRKKCRETDEVADLGRAL